MALNTRTKNLRRDWQDRIDAVMRVRKPLPGKSVNVWKYELLATVGSPDDFVVLSSGRIEASDSADAISSLAVVMINIRTHGCVIPNAIRLFDPGNEEILRALIAGPRAAVRQPVHCHPWALARRKRRHR